MTTTAPPLATLRCHATRLRMASRLMSQFYDAALEGSGIRTTQRAILSVVERSGPLTVGTLAQALVMDAGGLAHTLKPLIRDGLMSASVDPGDKRIRLICITTEGVRRLRASDSGFERAQAQFEQAFGADDAHALRHALGIIGSKAFREALADPHARRGAEDQF